MNAVCVTSNNKFIVSGSNDKTVRIWNFWTKNQEGVFIGHLSWVRTVAINHDDRFVISGGGDKTVRVWNLMEKKIETVFEDLQNSVLSVRFESNLQFVVCFDNGVMQNFNICKEL